MNKIILGDTHGNLDALKRTLRAHNVIDHDDNKNPNWWVGHVGDLCNMAPFGQIYRGFVSQDFETLEFGLEVIDELAVGNHELYFTHGGPMNSVGDWSGRAMFHELEEGLLNLMSQATLTGHHFIAAFEVDGMLVSHAGVSQWEPWMGDDPKEIADILTETLVDIVTASPPSHDTRWHRVLGLPRKMSDYNAVNSSIFWARPESEFGLGDWDGPAPFTQVVGHTPEFNNPRFDEKLNTWFLDNGGYAATKFGDHPNWNIGDFIPALVKLEGEDEWTPWTHP